MRKKLSLILLLVIMAASGCSSGKTSDADLQRQIEEIAKEANGEVGIYAVVIETGETVSLNAGERFALQSVVKLPIAMAVMKLVDEGKLQLDQKLRITKDEMVPSNMRSRIRDENPNGGEKTVQELIRLAISESDGTAADVLQRVAGGASGVQAYIDSLDIGEMKVRHSHKEFGEKWERQYENWATPASTFNLLTSLFKRPAGNKRDYQRDASYDLLMKFMTESNNPPNRIVAGLPKGTVVAHKTGTGGTRDGVTSATNDVGIITLPNGNHIAVALFVGDSHADLAAREGVIARITRVIFERWSKSKSSSADPVYRANFSDRHTLY